MAYINVDLDFLDHPKTKRFVASMGRGSEIYIIRLWIHTAKFHAKDGKWTGYSVKEIEGILGWEGKQGTLVERLSNAGLTVCERGGNGGRTLSVCSWCEHQGHVQSLRERGQKAAYARWSRLKGENVHDAQALLQASTSNAPTIPTIPTVPASNASMEEQRRKDEAERKKNALINQTLLTKISKLKPE